MIPWVESGRCMIKPSRARARKGGTGARVRVTMKMRVARDSRRERPCLGYDRLEKLNLEDIIVTSTSLPVASLDFDFSDLISRTIESYANYQGLK